MRVQNPYDISQLYGIIRDILQREPKLIGSLDLDALTVAGQLNSPEGIIQIGHDAAINNKLTVSGETILGNNLTVNGIGAFGTLTATDITAQTVTTTVSPISVSSFANSWVNEGSGTFYDAQYWKKDDIVYVRGRIKSGTVGSPAFTLPVGYRPSKRSRFVVDSNAAFGVMYVDSNGDVVPAAGSNVYFDFGLVHVSTA